MIQTLHKLVRDESGATAIEYGLLVCMIAIACIAAFQQLGNGSNGAFGAVMTRIGSVLLN